MNDARYRALLVKIQILERRLGSGTAVPGAHASSHYDGGGDPIDITQLDGYPGGATFLRADATFATPAGSGLTLLEQHTASSSAALNFTTWPSTAYDEYLIEVVQLVPATDATGIAIQVSTNGGSSYDTGNNYSWGGFFVVNNANANQGVESTSSMVLAQALSNTASEGGMNGFYRMFNPEGGAAFPHWTGQSSSISTANGDRRSVQWMSGTYNSTTAVDAFRVLAVSGNLASGTVRIYGFAK